MKLHDVELPDEALADFCRRWQITELTPFGSVLRDDFGPDSDVDLLATFAPGARWSLFDLVRMEEELTALAGRKVDLVQRKSVETRENYIRRRHILGAPAPVARRDDAYLLDILLLARKVQATMRGVTREAFEQDDVLQHALAWELTLLDQAAGKVSAATRAKLPEVPWSSVAGLRGRFEDDHFRLDLDVMWDFARRAAPELIAAIESLVPPEKD